VARELEVSSVVDGSFLSLGALIRVSVQLVSGEERATRWAGRYDLRADDLLQFQDDVALKVVEGLRVQLSRSEEQVMAVPITTSPEAYALYLQARYYWNEYYMHSRRESVHKAERLLEQAVAKDPLFAHAHALLSFFLAMEASNFPQAGDSLERAEVSARRAMDIDPRLPEALHALGTVYVQRGNPREAITILREALALAPNWELGLDVLGYAYHYAGLNELAEQCVRRCRELNPTSPRLHWMHGRFLLYLGRTQEAERVMRETVAAVPDQHKALAYLGKFLYYQGKLGEAEEVLARAHAAAGVGADPIVDHMSGYLAAAQGQRDRVDPAILALRPEEVFDGDIAYGLGGIRALLGDKTEALAWLRRAVDIGNHNYPWFQRDKNYDALRGDPEYQAILAEVRRHWEEYRELFGRG
jgi:tetratricopeptide (TPR) repeat protein